MALQALAGTRPVTQLAQDYQVSRKFVYQQAHQAEQALADAFTPDPPDDDRVLFYLPVTKAWLRRLVLALLLICHSSFRGVNELLRDLFDSPLSLGTSTTSPAPPWPGPGTSTGSKTCPPSASAPTTRSSRPTSRSWSASTSTPPIATC